MLPSLSAALDEISLRHHRAQDKGQLILIISQPCLFSFSKLLPQHCVAHHPLIAALRRRVLTSRLEVFRFRTLDA
jgi:hypothetical protein